MLVDMHKKKSCEYKIISFIYLFIGRDKSMDSFFISIVYFLNITRL